jgi:hypothetical protein
MLNMLMGASSSKKSKKGKKKKQKLEAKDQAKLMINPIKEVKLVGFSKMGYGPKKTES